MDVYEKAKLVRDMLVLSGLWSVIDNTEAAYWVTAKYTRQREGADRLAPWLEDPIVRCCLVQRMLWPSDGEGTLEHVARLLLRHRPRLGLVVLLARTWWPIDRDQALFRLIECAGADVSGIDVEHRALIRRRIEQLMNDQEEEVSSAAVEAGRDVPPGEVVISEMARNTFAASYYLSGSMHCKPEERLSWCDQLTGVAPDFAQDALAVAYRGPHYWVYTGESARKLAESMPRGPLV